MSEGMEGGGGEAHYRRINVQEWRKRKEKRGPKALYPSKGSLAILSILSILSVSFSSSFSPLFSPLNPLSRLFANDSCFLSIFSRKVSHTMVRKTGIQTCILRFQAPTITMWSFLKVVSLIAARVALWW